MAFSITCDPKKYYYKFSNRFNHYHYCLKFVYNILINGDRIFRNSDVHKTMCCFRFHLTFSITEKIKMESEDA